MEYDYAYDKDRKLAGMRGVREVSSSGILSTYSENYYFNDELTYTFFPDTGECEVSAAPFDDNCIPSEQFEISLSLYN